MAFMYIVSAQNYIIYSPDCETGKNSFLSGTRFCLFR